MLPLPNFSIYGVAEYLLFAVGLSAGMALFAEPMGKVESLIGNLRN
jgi:hypothetical protein|tara:strand:- start:775 stop:912 length:138 start_codon:yes stop_codon:yes gene_type:complete